MVNFSASVNSLGGGRTYREILTGSTTPSVSHVTSASRDVSSERYHHMVANRRRDPPTPNREEGRFPPLLVLVGLRRKLYG
jgi:hypothetical protein